MIRFDSPEWFFLIPLLALLGWRYRALRLTSPLRLTALVMLLFCLTQPVLTKGGTGLDVWVLIDQSKSAAGKPVAAADEIHSILERHKKTGDRIHLVDFGQSAVLREKGDPTFVGGTDGTDMEDALAYTIARMSKERANRILMVTDGWPTTPLEHAPERLISEKIPVDYRLVDTQREQDIRIEHINTPARIRPGEAFILEAVVAGPAGQGITVPWQISKNGGQPLKGQVTLVNGKGIVRLTDRLSTPGSYSYDMVITPQGDPITDNNRAVSFMEVTGGKAILLLSGYDEDPLAPFLKAQGFDVVCPANTMELKPPHLSGTGLVIINNLHASKIPVAFLQALDYYVREQGGGLLMCGGKQSFGSGGYFSSPIDAILPVSMELKKDKMKLITAMSIVMDRSGSMSCSAGGGKTKMDLANSGACQTLSLLGEQDFISVHAVDSSAHKMVDMMQIGENREAMLTSISRIESMGGGIFVGEGLREGWKELASAPAGTRHMILFADADDAEEPDDYKKTIEAMVKEGATLSVIALGTPASSDAKLLEEIATLGQGRIFFCDKPGDIPAVFAQETVSVARSTFINESTAMVGTAGWHQIAADSPAWPKAIDGYNLCYLREDATAACLTGDEYKAPLIAFWNRGTGRVAAVTMATGGEYGQSLQQWPQYGDLVQTLARWLNRKDPPPGYSVRAEMKGETLQVRLYYSDAALPGLAANMPTISLNSIKEKNTVTQNGVWERLQPGVFQSSFKLTPGALARGSVRIGDSAIPFGPLTPQTDPEWAMPAEAREAFLHMVARTGGKERLDLPAIFNEPIDTGELPLLIYLLWAAFALLLMDALASKVGILPKKKKEAA